MNSKTFACGQCGESYGRNMFSASQYKKCERNMYSRCKICLGHAQNNSKHFQCWQCGAWLSSGGFSQTQLKRAQKNEKGSCRNCLHDEDVTEFKKD